MKLRKKIKELTKKFAARLNQANSVTKTDSDNKLTSFNKRFTSNKTNHLEVENKLDSLIIKHHNFFLGRTYFIGKDGFQNVFAYQPTFKNRQRYCIHYWLEMNRFI